MVDKNYKIVKMHICKFEKSARGLVKDLNKYPVRLCVLDKERKVAVDVNTAFEYPYFKIISMNYVDRKTMELDFEKRYACIEYDSLLSPDITKEELLVCKEILNLLKQGVTFPDGNKELTDQEYLEMLNEEKNSDKILEKRK